MNSHLGKLVIVMLVVIAYLLYSNNQDSKVSQKKLQQVISELKQQVKTQEQNVESVSRKHMNQAVEQLEQSKEQSKKIDKQINELNKVRQNLEKKQKIEQEIMEQVQVTHEGALKASYIVQGLQTASSLKVHIAEYYMANGKFPRNNAELGIAQPSGFSSVSVKSIWVTQGKISIVYNEKSGIDKGTLNLTPKDKKHQLQWQCTTVDFKNISQYMPQCKYTK